MTKSFFISYGDNVIIERISVFGNTAKGKVIHSNSKDLPFGSLVLYQDSEYNELYLNEETKVDVVWRPKIKCILYTKEV